MREAIPPLPQYAFMAWCSVKSTGATLPFTFTYCIKQGGGDGWDVGEVRNAYKILAEKSKRKGPLRRPGRRREGNIKIYIEYAMCENVNSMNPAKNRDQLSARRTSHPGVKHLFCSFV